MARLGADPRVQQVAHFVRERMRQPLVRSGLIPGIDYATLLGPAHTDVERLTQAVGTAADVPADQLRADLLDRRWLALRTDDPRATRPHLIDRLGRPILRDRAIEGVPVVTIGHVQLLPCRCSPASRWTQRRDGAPFCWQRERQAFSKFSPRTYCPAR